MCGHIYYDSTYPRESNTANGIRENISDNGRVGVGGREVGVEVGRVPVCDLAKKNVTLNTSEKSNDQGMLT